MLKPKDHRIVFMGTPEFAIPSLDYLYNAGYDIAGVITAVDKFGGRGRKTLIESSVKKYAISKNLRILQPKNLKSKAFHEELRTLHADLQVVVAFRMLPEVVWSMPPLGTINLHGSLLPKYRGAAPINWAIMEGEKNTGLTTFFIRKEIDTGAILFQRKLPIYPYENAGMVHDRMKYQGAELVLKTVNAIFSDQYLITEQDHSQATKAPKIFHEMCQIDFSKPGKQVYDFIRGLSPYPAAWMLLDEKEVKILDAYYLPKETLETPGDITSDGKHYIKVSVPDGYIYIERLKMEGKRRMNVKNFLNGYQLRVRRN